MLDPIIISYKLTTIVSVTFYKIQQYPVKYIYNIRMIFETGLDWSCSFAPPVQFACKH